MFELAMTNLLAPPVLFFALGLFAAWAKSDLAMPDAAAKLLSLYLLLAIGFKGGVAASSAGLTPQLIGAIVVGITMSALMPVVVFPLFKRIAGLPRPRITDLSPLSPSSQRLTLRTAQASNFRDIWLQLRSLWRVRRF
jgi:hypothetical protein